MRATTTRVMTTGDRGDCSGDFHGGTAGGVPTAGGMPTGGGLPGAPAPCTSAT